MADEIYNIPENPHYNKAIRKIDDEDPVSASEILNPVLEQMMENTAAVKEQVDSLGELDSAGKIYKENEEGVVEIEGIASYEDMAGKIYAVSKEATIVKLENDITSTSFSASNTAGIQFSYEGSYFTIPGNQDQTIRVFQIAGGIVHEQTVRGSYITERSDGSGISPDGTYLVQMLNREPYIMIYKRNEDHVFEELGTPRYKLPRYGYCCGFSPDGKLMVVGHSTSPYITLYSVNQESGVFTKIDDPADVPPGSVYNVKFSSDGKHLVCGGDYSPYFTVYDVEGTTLTKVPVTGRVGQTVYGCDISSDGKYIVTGSGRSPYLNLFKRNENSGYTRVYSDETIEGFCMAVSFNEDASLVCGMFNSNSIGTSFFKVVDDSLEMIENPKIHLPEVGGLCSFDRTGKYLAIAKYHDLSVFKKDVASSLNVNHLGHKKIILPENSSLAPDAPFLVTYDAELDAFLLLASNYGEITKELHARISATDGDIKKLEEKLKNGGAAAIHAVLGNAAEIAGVASYKDMAGKIYAILLDRDNKNAKLEYDEIPVENASEVPSQNRDVGISNDGKYLVTCSTQSPSMYFFERGADGQYHFLNSDVFSEAHDSLYYCAMSPDGLYAVGLLNFPYNYVQHRAAVYKRGESGYKRITYLEGPDIGAGNNHSASVSFSNQGSYILVGSRAPDYFAIHRIEGHDTFSLVATAVDLGITANVLSCSMDEESNLLSVGLTGGETWVFKQSGDTFTRIAVLNTGYSASLSKGGNYLAVCARTPGTEWLSVYKRDGDTFIQLEKPYVIQSAYCNGVTFGGSDKYLLVSANNDLLLYRVAADGSFIYVSRQELKGQSYGIDMTPDGKYLATGQLNQGPVVYHTEPEGLNVNGLGGKPIDYHAGDEAEPDAPFFIYYDQEKDAFEPLTGGGTDNVHEIRETVDSHGRDIENLEGRVAVLEGSGGSALALTNHVAVDGAVKIDEVESYGDMAGKTYSVTPMDSGEIKVGQYEMVDSELLAMTKGAYKLSATKDGMFVAVDYFSQSPYSAAYKKTEDGYVNMNIPSSGGWCYSIAFSERGTYLAVGGRNAPYLYLYRRDGDTFKRLTLPSNPTGITYVTQFSHDEKTLIVGFNEEPFTLAYSLDGDTVTGKPVTFTHPAHYYPSNGVTFSPDDEIVSWCSQSFHYLTFFKNTDSGIHGMNLQTDYPYYTSSVYGGCFSLDSKYFVTVRLNYPSTEFVVLERGTDNKFTECSTMKFDKSNSINKISFSADGEFVFLMTGSSGSALYVFRFTEGTLEEVNTLPLSTAELNTTISGMEVLENDHILFTITRSNGSVYTLAPVSGSPECLKFLNVNGLGDKPVFSSGDGRAQWDVPALVSYNADEDGFDLVSPNYDEVIETLRSEIAETDSSNFVEKEEVGKLGGVWGISWDDIEFDQGSMSYFNRIAPCDIVVKSSHHDTKACSISHFTSGGISTAVSDSRNIVVASDGDRIAALGVDGNMEDPLSVSVGTEIHGLALTDKKKNQKAYYGVEGIQLMDDCDARHSCFKLTEAGVEMSSKVAESLAEALGSKGLSTVISDSAYEACTLTLQNGLSVIVSSSSGSESQGTTIQYRNDTAGTLGNILINAAATVSTPATAEMEPIAYHESRNIVDLSEHNAVTLLSGIAYGESDSVAIEMLIGDGDGGFWKLDGLVSYAGGGRIWLAATKLH